MMRISMPASSATIGCSIAALRVKVIGFAPCPLVGRRNIQFTVRFCATVSTDRPASVRSSSAVAITNRSPPSVRPTDPAPEATKMAAQQPDDQEHNQDKPEYPADAITTSPAIVAAAVISEDAPESDGWR